MTYLGRSGTCGQNTSSDLRSERRSAGIPRLSGVFVSALLATCVNRAVARDPVPTEPSIVEVRQALAAGRFDVRALERHYETRINTIDRAGARINSVLELNPDAAKIAAALDADAGREGRGERARQQPLFGVPILLKDNIDTGDGMLTTAGSLALVGSKRPRDAFIVRKLREAGALILGKTNLSEWANFRSTHSSSGWSGRGGQTRNPYALNRNPCGSSSGSAAAIAADLAVVAVGTETDGSLGGRCRRLADGARRLRPG